MIHATPIRRDAEGRYCLNDLHRAAGGAEKHAPKLWLRSAHAKGLIDEVTTCCSKRKSRASV